MSGITIVYNEHPAVPEEAVHNYIAGRGKNTIEEVIVDERVLCAAFFFFFFLQDFCTSVLQGSWWRWHTNVAVARQPCLETRWYGLEIMSVKGRVKRCTHAQIFRVLRRRLGLAERSCYSIRVWTTANGRQEETEIMRVGTQLCVCTHIHYLWALQRSCHRTADDIWLRARLQEGFPPESSGCNNPSLSEIIIWINITRCYV